MPAGPSQTVAYGGKSNNANVYTKEQREAANRQRALADGAWYIQQIKAKAESPSNRVGLEALDKYERNIYQNLKDFKGDIGQYGINAQNDIKTARSAAGRTSNLSAPKVSSATPLSNQSNYVIVGGKAVPKDAINPLIAVPQAKGNTPAERAVSQANIDRKNALTDNTFLKQQNITLALAQDVQRRRQELLAQGHSYEDAQKLATGTGITKDQLTVLNAVSQGQIIRDKATQIATAEELYKLQTKGLLPAGALDTLQKDIANKNLQAQLGTLNAVNKINVRVDETGADINPRRTNLLVKNALASGSKPTDLEFNATIDRTARSANQDTAVKIIDGRLNIDFEKIIGTANKSNVWLQGGETEGERISNVLKLAHSNYKGTTGQTLNETRNRGNTTRKVYEQTDAANQLSTIFGPNILQFVDIKNAFQIETKAGENGNVYIVKRGNQELYKTATETQLLQYLLQNRFIRVGIYNQGGHVFTGSEEKSLGSIIDFLSKQNALGQFADVLAQFENIRPQIFILQQQQAQRTLTGAQRKVKKSDITGTEVETPAGSILDRLATFINNLGVR